ncbi:MAG: hypothetical protein ISR65_02115 [Bacteriovoracaceae bacterium]|nr:hypothetical protein [Bacteriovoracaceae bacterium]
MERKHFYFAGILLIIMFLVLIFDYMKHHAPVNQGRHHAVVPAQNPNARRVKLTTPATTKYIAGGQYMCMRCSHTGIPKFNGTKSPRCSMCGGFMQTIRLSSVDAAKICGNFHCPHAKTGGRLIK